jgi:EmrB/QacA subfamily drug resistance transporter
LSVWHRARHPEALSVLTDSSEQLAFGSPRARWVLLATVGASGMAFLDSTVVNVALPQIGDTFDTDMAGLQWVINGYLVATSALILLGGSLGDLLGRRRVFLAGVLIFAGASMTCAIATNVWMLVLSRVVQGVGGALLTPGSLAILEASFRQEDRGRAIGAWSGLSGVASAIGPFLGGWLIDAASWRWVFFINIPLAALVVLVTVRHVPESRDETADGRIDTPGALFIGLALATVSWGLIAAGDYGWGSAEVLVPLLAGVIAFAAFVVTEMRSSHPMVPPSIFASAQFRAANIVTVAVYAGLGIVFFLFVVQLQVVLGYSALEAGAASLPITLLMLTLSSRSGHLAERIGPRLQMSAGPLLVAAGLAVMSTVDAGAHYVTGVLPGVILVGFGLAATVAPLTSTALGAVDDHHAGVASGVNTTVARAAQLAAVAVVPVVAGIGGDAYRDPVAFSDGFRTGMLIGAVLVATGGVLGWLLVRNPAPEKASERAARHIAPVGRFQCGVEAMPLDRCPGRSIPATTAPRTDAA